MIDPVNDFLCQGGAVWDMTKDTVAKNDVVFQSSRVSWMAVASGRACARLTDGLYARGLCLRRAAPPFGHKPVMFDRRMFFAGSWGADVHPDLRPAENDYRSRAPSAFER